MLCIICDVDGPSTGWTGTMYLHLGVTCHVKITLCYDDLWETFCINVHTLMERIPLFFFHCYCPNSASELCTKTGKYIWYTPHCCHSCGQTFEVPSAANHLMSYCAKQTFLLIHMQCKWHEHLINYFNYNLFCFA